MRIRKPTSKSSSARVLQLSLDRERKAMANGFVFRRKQEDAEEIPTGCALQRRRGDRKSTDRPAVKIQQVEETKKKKPPLASQPNHHSLYSLILLSSCYIFQGLVVLNIFQTCSKTLSVLFFLR